MKKPAKKAAKKPAPKKKAATKQATPKPAQSPPAAPPEKEAEPSFIAPDPELVGRHDVPLDADVLNAGFEVLLASAESHAEATSRAKQVAFLTALAIHGTITKAALESGIHRDTHYNWLDKDEAYAKAFKDAEAIFADQVRDEVRRRAVEGWLEPVFYMGIPTSVVRKHSDRLLELLAKAKCSEFREKHEITGEGGGPIRVLAVRYPEPVADVNAWKEKHVPKGIAPAEGESE